MNGSNFEDVEDRDGEWTAKHLFSPQTNPDQASDSHGMLGLQAGSRRHVLSSLSLHFTRLSRNVRTSRR